MPTLRTACLALLAALLAACTPDRPQPATGGGASAEIAEPYRGRPIALAASADGTYLAVAFETLGQGGLRHGGFFVLDGRDGRVLFTRPASMGRIRSIAVSDDGATVITVWACNHRGAWDRGCTGQRVVETDFRGNIESVRVQFDGEIHGAWQDPAQPGRLLALMGPTHVFPNGESAPCCRLRLIATPRGAGIGQAQQLGDWDLSGLAAAAPAVPLPGGGLKLLAQEIGGGARREVTLRPGAAPQIAPLPAALASLTGPQVALSRDGMRVLAVVGEGPARQIADDLLVARRDGGGEGASRRLGLRADIPLVALSADGRRGAFVSLPLGAADPQPVLHLLDLDAASAPRPVASLAANGLGRTWTRARVAPADLLARMKALGESGLLVDPQRAGPMLGLSLRQGDAEGTPAEVSVEGELAPFGLDSVYVVTDARGQAGAFQAHLRLAMHAGPCLTVAEVERVFGQPTRVDAIAAGGDVPRPRQPRRSLDYELRDGGSARFDFGHAHCARMAELRYLPPR